MFELIATICLWYTTMSPDKPICFINADVLKMQFESESGCHLVLNDLVRALDADLRARQVGMGLKCEKIDDTPQWKQFDTDPIIPELKEEMEKIPGIIEDLDIHN